MVVQQVVEEEVGGMDVDMDEGDGFFKNKKCGVVVVDCVFCIK